jgi:hypothetical protein
LPLESLSPFVKMAALHRQEAAHFSDRMSVCEQQDRSSPFGQSRGHTLPPEQSLEFDTLLGRRANDPFRVVLSHRNLPVATENDFASLDPGL